MGETRPVCRRVLPRSRIAAIVLLAAGIGLGGPASAQTITEFPIPSTNSYPWGIASGPDGNLWFAESIGGRIGRITPTGVITEFGPVTSPSQLTEIAAGPDGNLWFADWAGNRIGRITPAGTITTFPLPLAGSGPWAITAGPDGNVWFSEVSGNRIGRITPAGVTTEFTIPTSGSAAAGIAAGSDGNLWFTERNFGRIGRITTAGVITEFPIPTAGGGPGDIVAGPDGNLWFAEIFGNKIGRITTAGVVTEFTIPTSSSWPLGIAAGPDGSLWFAEDQANKIGRITTAGVVTEFPIPTSNSQPYDVATGSDGNLWFTESGANKIGRLALVSADLAVTKTDGVSEAIAGGSVVYTIQVTNAGPDPVINARVVDTFAASLTGVGWTCAASAGSSCAAASGSGSIDQTVSLLAGGTATFVATSTLDPAATGTLVNTVTVDAPSGSTDPSLANNTATDTDTILLPADVSVTKTDVQTTAGPGQAISYTITVSNAGPNSLTGVTVSDPVPAALLSPSWTCVAAGGASCTASGSGNINDSAVNLPVGGSVTYTFSGTLSASPASLSNTATASLPAGYGDPNPADNSSTDTDILLCGNETALVPDGRVTSTTLAPGATQWLLLATHTDYSYSLEVQNRFGTSGPGTLTLFRGVDGCTLTSTATSRDTSSIDPAAPTTAVRLAFTSSGADPGYRLRLTNSTASSIDYDLSLAETTLFAPAWTTNGAYNTYYSFQNTTGDTITATLTLTKTDGTSAGSSTISIPSGATASTNTASLSTPRNATGTARLTHDGPPGALLAEAAIANFSTNPAYIQPVKFKTVRETR